MKRILCFLFCIILLLSIVPVTGHAAYDGSCGENLNWSLDEKGTMTISGTGQMWNWDEGDTPWSFCSDDILELVVEAGVSSIGEYAFAGCTWLQKVHLPDRFARIGFGAFMGCTNLTEINFPNDLLQVEEFTFWDCTSLRSVTLGACVNEIKGSAFYGCTGLQEIWIPESVVKISSLAFYPMVIQDVYFEGNRNAWDQLGLNVPKAVQMHYKCESISAHWMPYCAGEWCNCGYSYPSENHTGIHVFDRQLAEEAFKASEATCEKPAMYYKSCICGIKGEGTFEFGEALGHVYDQRKVNEKYLVSEATCAEQAVYKLSCVCGDAGEETFQHGERKPHPYKDVDPDAYYHNAVAWAVQNKVTSGTGDGTTFEPNAVCTRGQVVTFLWRAAGQPEPKSAENSFKDVKTTDYFYKAVLWALENKITTGTGDGTTFEPHANCNRAQIVTFLSRANEGKAATNTNPFKDVASDAYYYNPVLWAVENGITTGTGDGTTFEPNADCTRGQVITFLWRAYKK